MPADPKITLIGAGSMSFGPLMSIDAIRSPKIHGGTLMLHDINEEKLSLAHSVAQKLNGKNGSPLKIEMSTDPAKAMDGSDFCLMSTEIARFPMWKMDYEIPIKYGSSQVNGESGGPGSVFHSLRSIKTCLGICANIEKYCPDTFLINFTNPMTRVTMAINRATKIRNVGLCHEFSRGVRRLGVYLGMPHEKIKAKAAGINHFTFFYEIRNADTGENLYPKLLETFNSRLLSYPPAVKKFVKFLSGIDVANYLVTEFYSPLVRRMLLDYGYMAASTDCHIGEYLGFSKEIMEPHVSSVDVNISICDKVEKLITGYAKDKSIIPLHLMRRSDEEAFKIIEGLRSGERTYLDAVNVPNRGYVPNLPDGAIVETPAFTGNGRLEPETTPPIHQPLADFMEVHTKIQDLVVTSALTGDPAPAFEALRMDPLSPPGEANCRKIFDELMEKQAAHLPF